MNEDVIEVITFRRTSSTYYCTIQVEVSIIVTRKVETFLVIGNYSPTFLFV